MVYLSFNHSAIFSLRLPNYLLRLTRAYVYALSSIYFLLTSLHIAVGFSLVSRLAIALCPKASFGNDRRLTEPMLFYLFHHLQAGLHHWVAKEPPITYRQLILIVSYLSLLTFLTKNQFLVEIPAAFPFTDSIGLQILETITSCMTPLLILVYVCLRTAWRRRNNETWCW